MGAHLARLWRLLRSRRVAAWLLAAAVAYMFVASVAPSGTDAFGSPLFFVLVAALATCTTACAWERTRLLVRSWRGHGRRGPEMVGQLGSPLFHASLALLLLVIGLGRATRSEGLVGLPLGVPVPDRHDSYRVLHEGPLYGERHSGLQMVASDFVLSHTEGGVDRGPSPTVSLYRGDARVARGRLFPNRPLRHGSLLLHMNDYGLALRVSLEETGAATSATEELLLDFPTGVGPGARASAAFDVLDDEGLVSHVVTASIALDDKAGRVLKRMPVNPAVIAIIAPTDGTRPSVERLSSGVDVELPGGAGRLRLESVDYYVRVSVVDDWSVTPMYVLIGSACVGLVIALLARPVRSRVPADDDASTSRDLGEGDQP